MASKSNTKGIDGFRVKQSTTLCQTQIFLNWHFQHYDIIFSVITWFLRQQIQNSTCQLSEAGTIWSNIQLGSTALWNIPRRCLGIFQRASEPCWIFWQTVLGDASNCLHWNRLQLIWNHPRHVEVALGCASGYFNMPRIISNQPQPISAKSFCLLKLPLLFHIK